MLSALPQGQIVPTDRVHRMRRFAGAFGTDLAVSLGLVLITARLLGMFGVGGPKDGWLLGLHAAVERFTPFGLWDVYRAQIGFAIAELKYLPGTGSFRDLVAALESLSQVALAAPATMLAIWQQTHSLSDWISLAGFVAVLLTLFAAVLLGGRLSLARLAVALIVSPIATAGLFWLAQNTVLDLLDGIGWVAPILPWLLLCPVACAVYWACFPQNEHGAAAAVLNLVGRLRLGLRFWTIPRRGRAMGDLARPQPRK